MDQVLETLPAPPPDRVVSGGMCTAGARGLCRCPPHPSVFTAPHMTGTATQIWFWFVQLVMVLRFLAQRRVLHRDIKPQNIMVTGFRALMLKLADFGISKALADGVSLASSALVARVAVDRVGAVRVHWLAARR